ncbi:hypothetical protein ACVDG3_14335 [Meridianimarinicoccus sp. RP-17]|uniref:hypothetical protein n=1 Tax=Meridianimarinicoccus zhengii TaxID=2056810 RepID=UPI000DABA090|nr:hypothetical protein [Phycocomes zhengii]
MAILIGMGLSGMSAQAGTEPPAAIGPVAAVAPMAVADAVFDSGAAQGANAADIPLSGTTTAPDGAQVEARIVRADTGAQVHPWTTVASAADGAWSGTVADVPRSVHWLGAEVRVRGSAAPAGRMAGRFGVGHVWAIWEQSNWSRLLLGYPGYAIAPETVTHPDDVQIWRVSRFEGSTATGTASKAPVNDATAAAGQVTPAAVAFANTLTAARPGEKFAIAGHLVSGTSPVDMINPADLSRKWADEVVLHDAFTAHGTPVGIAFNNGWVAWDTSPRNVQKMVPIMTGKLVDGTPVALGETVDLGPESFVLHHSMTELYDLSYTKMGFIGPQGRFVANGPDVNTFSLTLLSEIADPNYESVRQGWSAVLADKANFPEMLDYQWETIGAQRGVDDGAGGWEDTSHFSAEDDDGLPRHGRIGANHMLRAAGLLAFDRPEITHSDWTPTHIDLWNPDHDITTERTLRGGTSAAVRGFAFAGTLLTTEAQLVPDAGGSGRQGIRITPAGGVDGSETLEFGRGSLPGATEGPAFYRDKHILDLPVMDVGQAGLAALPVVTRPAIVSNLAGATEIVRDGSQAAFSDPNPLGSGVTGLTIKGEIRRATGVGGTISFGSGNIYKLEMLSDGLARISVNSSGATIGQQQTANTVFTDGAFVPFVWTVDLAAGTTTIWYGDTGMETFALSGTGGTLSSGRAITLLPTSLVADVRFVEVWKSATAVRDTSGLGAPHKRIEAGAGGAPVQIPALPSW